MARDSSTLTSNPLPVTNTRWQSAGLGQKAGIVAGFSAMVILGAMIISWAWSPSYKVLFSSLDDQDVIAVLNTLHSNGFDAQLDVTTGAIKVPGNDLHFARIKLSDLGLPRKQNLYSNLHEGSQYWASSNITPDPDKAQRNNNLNLEDVLGLRVERLLQPLVGMDSVRVQVSINTQIKGDANSRNNNSLAGKHKQGNNEDRAHTNGNPENVSTQIGENEYLTITVILADKQVLGSEGNITRIPRNEDEIETLTEIIKNAVGFSSSRGDTINVIHPGLIKSTVPETSTRTGFVEDILAREWVKKGTGVILLSLLASLAFLFFLKTVMFRPRQDWTESGNQFSPVQVMDTAELAMDNFDNNMRTASTLAEQDPRLVAQVIRNWVHADG